MIGESAGLGAGVAREHLGRGNELLVQRRYEQSLDSYEAAIALKALRRPEAALASYDRTLAIVPAKRGPGAADTARQGSATPKHVSMSCAQRLKRVFGIQINRCEHCGGAVKIIASIEDPEVIGRILQHLGLDRRANSSQRLPAVRILCGGP